jgi:CubicO group peptidase (beta-lactamase class C family)
MTATLVAAAVEAGVVGWDDTVGGLLGAMAGGAAPEPYRDVTFDHLLSHRAGLAPNLPIPDLMAYPLEEADPRASRRDYVARALAAPAVAAPGAAFAYSNSGYVLAAAMLEAKLDAPWEAIIAERLFAPLGLASAGFGAPDPGPAPDSPQAPVGHTASVGALIGASKRRRPVPPGGGRTDNPAVLAPAGGVHMSLGDLLAYLDAHRLKGPLLQAGSWTRLQSPAFGGDYALGWFVKPDGALWHNGSNTLWYAEAVIDPGAGVSAAAAANDGLMACSSIATSEALASARATP